MILMRNFPLNYKCNLMRKLALLALCALYFQWAPAQERCVPMMKSEDQIIQFENWINKKKLVKSQSTQSLRSSATIYTIPVVFHVLHKGEPLGSGYNVSNERIQEQIDILNEDFRKSNPRSSSVPTMFKSVEADIEIEFVLARQDPDGLPTNGIVRKNVGRSYTYPSNILKAESYWPSEDYFNIWVADINVLGWATYPEGSGLSDITNPETIPERDGVVIDGMYIGTNLNTGGLFESYGQTVTHEIGHFLGLYHIWGGSGCIADDYCNDTPLASGDNSGIKSPCTFPGPDSCTDDAFPDMFMNFMDYSDDACMSMFTEDQKTRMRIVLENSPRRLSLLTSPGLEYPLGVLNLDMAVHAIDDLPIVSCTETLAPSVVFSNYGSDNVTSFSVDYTINGNSSSLNFTGLNLVTGEQYVINPTLLGVTTGEQLASWQITSVNSLVDENDLNDFKEIKFSVLTDELPTPFKESFTASNWYPTSPNGISEWQKFTIIENEMYVVSAYNNASPTESWLVSPYFTLTNYSSAGLFFKLSYGQSLFSDGLEVKVSTGCTNTFETIWSSDLDALDFAESAGAWIPENDGDWKEFFIDLSPYKNLPEVRLAFVFKNNGGNNLYLDDVELTNNGNPVQPRLKEGRFIAYPNPAQDQFSITLNLPETQNVRVQLVSITGAIVLDMKFEQLLNETIQMDTGQLYGTYFIRVIGKDINQTQRILIGR